MEDGIINLDTGRGRILGFTSDRYEDGSYLWKDGEAVLICFIYSKAKSKGNFRALVERILAKGWSVKVPTPLPNMERILRKNGYRRTEVFDKDMGETVVIWVLDPA